MRARWIVPVICYSVLLAAEIIVAGNSLLPKTTGLAFANLYLLVPLLSFILALILSATNTNLFLKLFFPVVSLVVLPFSYLLYESRDGSPVDLKHLAPDFGLALIVAFAPAVLGSIIGFILWGVKKRRGGYASSASKMSSSASKVSHRIKPGVQTRNQTGSRTRGRTSTSGRTGARSQPSTSSQPSANIRTGGTASGQTSARTRSQTGSRTSGQAGTQTRAKGKPNSLPGPKLRVVSKSGQSTKRPPNSTNSKTRRRR
ncbi:MAG: hypothetical protein LBL27_04545 [Coriobacteriales bacterium]|jgi:hypothetical protein|nr:hypothetical protein [Coriobacteriales bacterium]